MKIFLKPNRTLKNMNLDYDFQDVDELYLDDYKPVGFVWNE